MFSDAYPLWRFRLLAALCTFGFCCPDAGLAFFTTVENDYYVAHVIDGSGPAAPDSIGGFQLTTGPLHPAGANRQVTFGSSGNINIGTSFSGIRVGGDNANVYTSDAHGEGAASPVLNLDDFFSTEGPTPGYNGTGWRTLWDLFPEQLEIVQDVIVFGDDPTGSAIYHTVEIRNGRSAPVLVEWLNLIDFDLLNDGGPKQTVEESNGTVILDSRHEYTRVPGIDELARISSFPSAEDYEAFWTISHDPGLLPELQGEPLVTTPADELQYVAWSAAFDPANFGIQENVFDYITDGGLDVATSLDAAGIASFSHTIPVNESFRITQAFWVRQIPEPSCAWPVVCLLGIMLSLVRRPANAAP